MAVTQFARLDTAEVIDLLSRQLERFKAVLVPAGVSIQGGSLEMMSTQQWTKESIIICPLHQPMRTRFDRSTHAGIIIDGVFDVYYRHRGMLDEAKSSKVWLKDYYACLVKVAEKLVDWWPIDWEGTYEGKRMTIEPINGRMMNEPRKSWKDNGIGEGMLELMVSYVLKIPAEPIQG